MKQYQSIKQRLQPFKYSPQNEIDLYQSLQIKRPKEYDEYDFDCDLIVISHNFTFFALFVDQCGEDDEEDDDDEEDEDEESEEDEEDEFNSSPTHFKKYVVIVQTSSNKCFFKEKSENQSQGLFSPDDRYFAYLCEDSIRIINLTTKQKIVIQETIENFLSASFDSNHNFYLITDNNLKIQSLRKNINKNIVIDIGEDLDFEAIFLQQSFLIMKREEMFEVYDFRQKRIINQWRIKQSQNDEEIPMKICKQLFLVEQLEEQHTQLKVWYIPKGKLLRKYETPEDFLSTNLESLQTISFVTLQVKGEYPLIQKRDLLRGQERRQFASINCYIADNDIPRQISSKLFVQVESEKVMYFS